MDDLKKNPEDEAKDDEVESPVDGPMPDWMRLATSGGSGSSLTEENTPAWLKSIRSGQGLSKDKPAEPAKQTPPPPAQASDDSMSDLERLLAEEGIDLGSVAEERPEGAGGMSARDWLIATSSEEIIRNKVGAQPMEKPAPPPAPTISPPSAPPSPPQAIQTSDDSMSDLERLLAEEGIDLGSVAEERPEGAGGMSARDWLISTSGEEIIRNKLGVKPVEEPPAPAPVPSPSTPPLSSSLMDDKMVVEEDLPDWLQEIAADSMEAEPSFVFDTAPLVESTSVAENDQFVVEDDLPDWLQEVADETSGDMEVGGTVPAPLPEQSGTAPVQDKMVVAEDLPDWLRDIAEEPATASESEIPPVPAAPASFADDKMVVEEDLPDWLRDMAEEPAAPAEPTTPFTQTPPPAPVEDGLVIEEDLPDWLREAAEPAVDLPVADWPASATANADKMVVQEDLPDWLQEIADEPTLTPELDVAELITPDLPSKAEDKIVAEEDLPDWLRSVAAEPVTSPKPDEPPSFSTPPTGDKMIVEEDLPDWLREVEIGGSESETISTQTGFDRVVAELEETESDEDLPDWLREVEVSNLEDNLALPLMKPAAETSPESDFALNTPLGDEELDLLNEEDLPAWLKEVQERNGQEPSNVPSQPITSSTDSFGLVMEEELPDWLRDAQEETTPLAFEELEPVVHQELRPGEEDLPDWLREEQFDRDEPFEASEPAPETLAESDLVVAEELPDWLQEVQDETPEETPFEEEIPAPIVSPTRLDTDEMIDQEGLPDWLREAAEEETEPLPEEAFAATPQPVAVVSETVVVVTEVAEEIPSEEVVAAKETAPVSQPETAPAPISEPPVSVAETSGALPDWLQKLRQVDEEEITPVPLAPVSVVSALLPAPAAVAKATPRPVYTPAPVATAPPPDMPADAEERLKRARTARDKGDISEAMGIYDSLVANGVYLDKIIEDMQQTIKAQPGNYLLYQLMGDAMMRNGRLQSALNAYREALLKL